MFICCLRPPSSTEDATAAATEEDVDDTACLPAGSPRKETCTSTGPFKALVHHLDVAEEEPRPVPAGDCTERPQRPKEALAFGMLQQQRLSKGGHVPVRLCE